MTTPQTRVLAFWASEKRQGAIFEGRTITPADIKADPKLALRYWQRQLCGCVRNVEAAQAKHQRAREVQAGKERRG